MDHKKRLRGFYRKKIQAKNNSDKNQAITEALFRLNLSQFLKSTTKSQQSLSPTMVAGYQALKGEPFLLDFYKKKAPWHFVFPLMKTKEDMTFYKPGKSQAFRQHPLGFHEPNPETAESIPAHCIKIFLVPGLAFDRQGRRLGRGLGCYDRFLSKKQALKVGITWSDHIHKEKLPENSHDIPMDIIVTDKFILIPDIRTSYLSHFERARYG